jgi:outer membrane protein OmpA-like peptidoglycan-associated protein
LILELEDLLKGESPADHTGAWTVEEIVEILSRDGERGPSRYDGPRLPLRLDFRPEDAALGQTAKAQLAEVAEALREGILVGIPIEIEGHTDSVEANTETGRMALAWKRAEAVKDFLVRQHGIPAGQLHIKALADLYPLKANNSPDGRTANRRVELVNMESKQPLLKDIRTRD